MDNAGKNQRSPLTINTDAETIIYLSVSWQPDVGKDFGSKIVKRLDQKGIIIIGDVKGQKDMDPERIRRIMSQAECFISILPFRPGEKTQTSPYILPEIEIAVALGMSIILIFDSRIPIASDEENGERSFIFNGNYKLKILILNIALTDFYYDGVESSEEIQSIRIAEAIFISKKTSKLNNQPYSFLICRIQPDFELPRLACKAAAEAASGIPCVWISSEDYNAEDNETTERVKHFIKNAQFVIAEISLADENVEVDNASRAHEIGLASAFDKKIFLVSHYPTRTLYHGVVTWPVTWWNKESDLFDSLNKAIYNDRAAIGRYIYNYELKKTEIFQPKFAIPALNAHETKPWSPPLSEKLTDFQRWMYTLSFGIITMCVSYIVEKMGHFHQTLEVVPLFAGLITFFFSSHVNRDIQQVLLREAYLKWFIPLVAFVLLCFCAWLVLNSTAHN